MTMDADVAQKLARIYELTRMPGWADLEEDLKEKMDAIKDALAHDVSVTHELLKIAQGRILAYRDILAIPVLVEHTLNQVDEDPNDEATNK